jgi:hypothetical protein
MCTLHSKWTPCTSTDVTHRQPRMAVSQSVKVFAVEAGSRSCRPSASPSPPHTMITSKDSWIETHNHLPAVIRRGRIPGRAAVAAASCRRPTTWISAGSDAIRPRDRRPTSADRREAGTRKRETRRRLCNRRREGTSLDSAASDSNWHERRDPGCVRTAVYNKRNSTSFNNQYGERPIVRHRRNNF